MAKGRVRAPASTWFVQLERVRVAPDALVWGVAEMNLNSFDPIELAVFKSATRSVAEEMGAALRRTAFSPNIKERRDYSCAIFDSAGQVIAMGDHMPVHLGSMPMSVRAAMDALTLESGDIAILND